MGNFLSKSKITSTLTTTPTPAPTTDKEAKMSPSSTPLKMSHYPSAQSAFEPPLIAHNNHFLGDVFDSTDAEKPLSCGFYRFEKGETLTYTYTYHEMKIILEGEATITDETGQSVSAKPGDVFYFPKGSVISFTTPSFCKAFYTGQRARGAA